MDEESIKLLSRIDERLRGLKNGNTGDIPDIVRHLEALNSQVSKNKLSNAECKTSIKYICGVGGAIFTVLSTCLLHVMGVF